MGGQDICLINFCLTCCVAWLVNLLSLDKSLSKYILEMWLQFQYRIAQSQNFVHAKIIMKFKYDGWSQEGYDILCDWV